MRTFKEFRENAPPSSYRGWQLPQFKNSRVLGPMQDKMIDNNYSARDLAHFLNRFMGPIEQNAKVIRDRFQKRYADDQNIRMDLMPIVRQFDDQIHYLKVAVHEIKNLNQQADRGHVEFFMYRLHNFVEWLEKEATHLEEVGNTAGSEEDNYDGWGDIGRASVVIKNEMVKRYRVVLDYIRNSKIEDYLRNVWGAVK